MWRVLSDQGKGSCFWDSQLDKWYHISDLSSKWHGVFVIGFKCNFTNLLHGFLHFWSYTYHMLTWCIIHDQTMRSRRGYHTNPVDGVASFLFVLLCLYLCILYTMPLYCSHSSDVRDVSYWWCSLGALYTLAKTLQNTSFTENLPDMTPS